MRVERQRLLNTRRGRAMRIESEARRGRFDLKGQRLECELRRGEERARRGEGGARRGRGELRGALAALVLGESLWLHALT
jgi:hypothetical protein